MKRTFTIALLCLLAAGCALRRPVGGPPPPPSKAERVLQVLTELAEIAAEYGADNSWGRHCLPEHLRDRKHDDWPPPLNQIPRWANAFCGSEPVWGEGSARNEIPAPGQETYYLVDMDGHRRPYYARTTENCWHFRVGFRRDGPDGYYNFIPPQLFTFKRVPGCELPSTDNLTLETDNGRD